MHVEKFEHKQQNIHSQIPCGITFHMKCTCLHIIFTRKNCVWMHVEKFEHKQKKKQSKPVWQYISHEMHILAQYFHTARITYGCMWRSFGYIQQQFSHIPCDTKFHMKHTYTLTSHSTSSFEEFKISMVRDLYIIQLYKIYYKNIHHILPVYMFSKDFHLTIIMTQCTTII